MLLGVCYAGNSLIFKHYLHGSVKIRTRPCRRRRLFKVDEDKGEISLWNPRLQRFQRFVFSTSYVGDGVMYEERVPQEIYLVANKGFTMLGWSPAADIDTAFFDVPQFPIAGLAFSRGKPVIYDESGGREVSYPDLRDAAIIYASSGRDLEEARKAVKTGFVINIDLIPRTYPASLMKPAEERAKYYYEILKKNYEFLVALGRLSGIGFAALDLIGKVGGFMSLILARYYKLNNWVIPLESERGREIGSYRGGYIVNPTVGFHQNVYEVDFRMMYPHIITEYRIDLNTVNCGHDECKDNRPRKLDEHDLYFCKYAKKTILPELVEGLIKARYALQERGLDSYPAKVMAAASYGILGNRQGIFYFPYGARMITALGRMRIKDLIAYEERHGHEILHVHTDGLVVKSVDGSSEKLVPRKFSDLIKVKKFSWILIINKTARIWLEEGASSPEFKGVEGLRHNTPPLLKKIFDGIRYDSPRSFIESLKKRYEEVRKAIREAGPRELAFTVKLSKDGDKYSPKSHMYQIAKGFKRGDVIEYVKTVNGWKIVTEATPQELDRKYYESMLESIVNQILKVVGEPVQTTLV